MYQPKAEPPGERLYAKEPPQPATSGSYAKPLRAEFYAPLAHRARDSVRERRLGGTAFEPPSPVPLSPQTPRGSVSFTKAEVGRVHSPRPMSPRGVTVAAPPSVYGRHTYASKQVDRADRVPSPCRPRPPPIAPTPANDLVRRLTTVDAELAQLDGRFDGLAEPPTAASPLPSPRGHHHSPAPSPRAYPSPIPSPRASFVTSFTSSALPPSGPASPRSTAALGPTSAAAGGTLSPTNTGAAAKPIVPKLILTGGGGSTRVLCPDAARGASASGIGNLTGWGQPDAHSPRRGRVPSPPASPRRVLAPAMACEEVCVGPLTRV